MIQEPYALKFKSLRQAVRALYDKGYEISRSKMSRDKKNGLIDFNPDNTVDQKEVEKYARLLKKREPDLGDSKEKQKVKIDWEIKNLELKHEKELFLFERDKGKWIERALFEAELAARAVIFETGLKYRINKDIQELIAIVGGKPEKAPDLIAKTDELIEVELNSYATTKRFQVVFIGDDEE